MRRKNNLNKRIYSPLQHFCLHLLKKQLHQSHCYHPDDCKQFQDPLKRIVGVFQIPMEEVQDIISCWISSRMQALIRRQFQSVRPYYIRQSQSGITQLLAPALQKGWRRNTLNCLKGWNICSLTYPEFLSGSDHH